ncbi:thioesterase II family protein [Streptomyces sennicomposti]|uniref:thioesterase II family protein n=1 Tax=Streptomyces sennicomposti TaxID=2873384 RepID=UPI001CA7A769|nr:alpha/beta fold hydrolase [Streptomyces sennicomposti]MBY8867938.1 alpha/beta fold hydrolase [Streptomyces sennicomposti]
MSPPANSLTTLPAHRLTGTAADWLREYAPAEPDAPCLVSFPHAGGSAGFFTPLARALAPAVRVLAVQYPGRLERRTHPPVHDIRELAARTLTAIGEAVHGTPVAQGRAPLLYFGHSMGSLVAFETALLGERGHGPAPAALLASGGRAPALTRVDPAILRGDDSLVAEVLRLGGTERAVLDDPDLRELVLPALRADYRALHDYVPEPAARVRCPVRALVGDRDPLVPVADARRWADHTTGPFALRVLPGDHFYLNPRLPDVADTVRAVLAEVAELS